MPVNLRPHERRDDIVGNYASYVSVSGGSVRAIARQTEAVKRDNLAGAVVNLASSPMTVGVKRRLPDLVPLTSNTAVDTATPSNLGVLESLGDDVEAVAFSPPGRMPLGTAIGVVTHRGRLYATLRYRRAQFGRTPRRPSRASSVAPLRTVTAARPDSSRRPLGRPRSPSDSRLS